MKLRWLWLLIPLAWLALPTALPTALDPTPAALPHAPHKSAVVRIGGCSGVCVSADGLVLTCRHCDLPDQLTIHFPDGDVRAHKLWESDNPIGVSVFQCDSEHPLPHLPLSPRPGYLGECCTTYGHPGTGTPARPLRWTCGRLLHTATQATNDQPSVPLNLFGFGVSPGWSGGPVLTADGQVCGLVEAIQQDGSTSALSWRDLQAAVQAARANPRPSPTPDPRLIAPVAPVAPVAPIASPTQPVPPQPTPAPTKPTLQIFGASWCGPCLQFHRDLDGPLRWVREQYTLEWIDVDRDPDRAKSQGVTTVPTFICGDLRIIGYIPVNWGVTAASPTPERPPLIDEDLTDAPPYIPSISPEIAPAERSPNPRASSAVPPDQGSRTDPGTAQPTSPPVATSRPLIRLAPWVLPALKVAFPQAALGLTAASLLWGAYNWYRSAAANRATTQAQPTANPQPPTAPAPVTFPELHKDYSKVFVDHIMASGENPATLAAELECYTDAYARLQRNELTTPGVSIAQQLTLVKRVRSWVLRSFQDRHLHAANVNNVNHQAFLAWLYRRATDLLGEGEFGRDFDAAAAAETIRDYVATCFHDRLTAPVV